MTEMELLREIGMIREEYILEASPEAAGPSISERKKRRYRRQLGIAAAAAAALLVLTIHPALTRRSESLAPLDGGAKTEQAAAEEAATLAETLAAAPAETVAEMAADAAETAADSAVTSATPAATTAAALYSATAAPAEFRADEAAEEAIEDEAFPAPAAVEEAAPEAAAAEAELDEAVSMAPGNMAAAEAKSGTAVTGAAEKKAVAPAAGASGRKAAEDAGARGDQAAVNGLQSQGMQMANPWIDYQSLEEAAAAADVSIAIPEKALSELDAEAANYRAIPGSLLEVICRNQAGDEVLRIRKAPASAEDGDISGDYNSYEHVEELEDGGRIYRLSGNSGKISLATWTEAGCSFAVSAAGEGLDRNELLQLLREIR